jgi:hypothetical protein
MEVRHQPEKEQAAVDRAVCVLFGAIVAHAKCESAALAQARREFLAIAADVGPTFQPRLIERAVARLVRDLPKALPQDAARAVRNDCIRLFGRDLCWCDLGAIDPEGSA